MEARVHSASVKLALDINFGDPITPAPELIDYPALLPGMAPVRILGYPVHTVLAEKITTAVNLGATSTRVRDYLDIWTLTGIHDLDASPTRAALEATAAHRQITLRPLSQASPSGSRPTFLPDPPPASSCGPSPRDPRPGTRAAGPEVHHGRSRVVVLGPVVLHGLRSRP
jgi:hypothetical protein